MYTQINSSSELDNTTYSSDYSYWSESDSENDTLESCELSSSNYTDNSDYLSFNESSAYTCELSTHNYTPNTVFSPNESESELSSYQISTQSLERLNNSDVDYVKVSAVINVFCSEENLVNKSQTNTQELYTEMGNSSNKVEPAPETTTTTTCTTRYKSRNKRNKSFRNRSIKKNVSLLAFNMTPVCLGVAESTTALAHTFSGSYERKSAPSKSLTSLLQDSASLPNLRSQDVSSSTESTSSSCSSLFEEQVLEIKYVPRCQDLSSSTSSHDSDSSDFLESHSTCEASIQHHSLSEQNPSTIGMALTSLNRSLEEISKSLDMYENNMEELSKLHDLSETFSSLDSSLNSILSDELEDLDSSFSSISSFDSSDSFVYQPLNTSPTVHHQVKFNPYKSLEFLSTEKLIPETDEGIVPLLFEGNPSKTTISKRPTSMDSEHFSPCASKSTASCENDSKSFPQASTPVSKLLSSAAAALTTYSPRPLFSELSGSDCSLESGCESQDSGYSTNKLSLSSNTQSSASSSTERVALVGRSHKDIGLSSLGSSSDCSSNSYEDINSFLGSYESCSSTNSNKFSHCSYTVKNCSPRIASLMYSPEKSGPAPPPLPEKPMSPLRAVVASSNDTSMSSLQPFSSANSSTHPLYSSIHCLNISPTKPRKPSLFSKKLKSLKNLMKRRRSSCEVKRIGKERQHYAVPYEMNSSTESIPQKLGPTAARVLQLL